MKVFNTQTRTKEELVPVEPGVVRMYVCGPTVYNYFHIGNARPFVVFDTLRRYLEHKGYKVIYVQNFTDIDDKMIRRAQEESITIGELADRFIAAYFEDAEALGIHRATVHPRATEHMAEMVDIIRRLEEKGLAYAAEGDVYFDTGAYRAAYGKLSGQNLMELETGARVEVDEKKRHPMDFALWKAQKPGEPAWESPWGPGRPGWHIECSAMSMKYLGETVDIHGGGEDLIFPHHENEQAQSEGATGKPFVKYWMHNAFLNINDEKMSKSLGNFRTVREIRAQMDPEAIRFFLLCAHYRSPLNFSPELVEQARSALERLSTARHHYRFMLERAAERPLSERDLALSAAAREAVSRFDAAMDDDMNTADAIGALFELVKRANTEMEAETARDAIQAVLDAMAEMLGVLGVLQGGEMDLETRFQDLLAARAQARKEKNWQESDRIRDLLKEQGYTVEDTAQGQSIRKA